MKQIVFDIEANGLKPTKVWVIVATELDTRETHTFSGDTLCRSTITSQVLESVRS